jgi:hypothetical protein
MGTLQNLTAGGLLAQLGTSGQCGISAAANGHNATRLDITVSQGAWAFLPDGTLLSSELRSTQLRGITQSGTLWLDYVETAGGLLPVWSVAPAAPSQSALDIADITTRAGAISGSTAKAHGLRNVPLQGAGTPTLYGPYVVAYTDIPHDGDKKTLWTPAVGDVLLRLFSDPSTRQGWDKGLLYIGQNVDGRAPGPPPKNALAYQNATPTDGAGHPDLGQLDMGFQEQVYDASYNGVLTTAYVFHTTDPVQIQLAQTAGTDPTAGHVELYALMAHPVAPS